MLLLVLACTKSNISDSGQIAEDLDRDDDGWQNEDDCQPDDSTIHPAAEETCDGLDNDCDEVIDEDVQNTFYADTDDDGYGDPDAPLEACGRPAGYALTGNDCDDSSADIYPGAAEICNDLDDDCDEEIDEDVKTTWWADVDTDGFGDPETETEACEAPDGHVSIADDCDDTDATSFPGGTEVCDEADNDCDGTVDEDVTTTYWADADTDGYGDSDLPTEACSLPTGYAEIDGDCDDAAEDDYPGATETKADGIDQDCDDGDLCYRDGDKDGYGGSSDAASTDLDCADKGEAESDTDCDDGDDSVYPGADEYCNDTDDDCDTDIDEDAVDADTWYLDDDKDGFGDATSTTEDCDEPSGYTDDDTDCDDTDGDIYPGADEYCNDEDDDCDGDIDNDALDVDTWYLDDDGDGYGDATTTTEDCDEPSGYTDDDTDCDDTDYDINPGASETCNGEDDDCDTDIDEGVLGTGTDCPAEDCSEVLSDNASATDGDYELDAGTYTCDMTTDGGGWTLVGDDVSVYGTGYDTTYYNSEGFTWIEVLFEYDSGSAHAHCTYPSSLTGCNNLGFQFASESWGVPLNWGSSICGMSTTDYTGNTNYIGGYDFVIDRSSSTDTVRLGTLEGISSCTTGDNPGTAYTDIWVRQ